jgi:hypothetical protein
MNKLFPYLCLVLCVVCACGKRVGVSSTVTPHPIATVSPTGTNAEPMPTPEPVMSPIEIDAEPSVTPTPTVNPKQQEVQR